MPTAHEIASAVRQGEVEFLAPAAESVSLVRAEDPASTAVISLLDDVSAAHAGGTRTGALAGVPVLLKELGVHARGLPCREGLDTEPRPAGSDSWFVQRVRNAGAVIVGTTSTAQLGLSARMDDLPTGVVDHPWLAGRDPGGSSGGSAVAVARGWVPLAHGTDGAGSLRVPAALCGLYGLKPSRGAVSFGPVIGDVFLSLASNFFVARDADDLQLAMGVVYGDAAGDWLPRTSIDTSASALRGDESFVLSVGLPESSPVCDPEIEAAVMEVGARLGRAGHRVELHDPWIFGSQRDVQNFEVVWAAMGAEAVTRAQKSGAEVNETSMFWAERARTLNAGVLATATVELTRVGRRLERDLFSRGEFIITPTCPRTAPAQRRPGEVSGDVSRNESLRELLPYTYGVNIAGLPAISVPCGRHGDGSGIGVQIIGRHGTDAQLVAIARALATDELA